MDARRGDGMNAPLSVRLYRCDGCHAVHAFQVYQNESTGGYDLCGTTRDCVCGVHGWTLVRVIP